ncbi:C40 family peptidase [bacterium]|nr:C40 family peptidase [bacterium]
MAALLLVSCAYHPDSRYSDRPEATPSPLDPELVERFKAEIRRFWQAPYVWGGASPQGTDCSGLVYSLYRRAADQTIPRLTTDMYTEGLPVNWKNLHFADLVFFSMGAGRTPRHVGLYIDRGFFIHASVSNGVTLSHISDSPYMETYLGARRYLK